MNAVLKIFFLLFLIINGLHSKAQSYDHAIGLGLNVSNFKESYKDNTGLNNNVNYIPAIGVFYKSSLMFQVSRFQKIAITTYPFLGYSMSKHTHGKLAFEIPVLLELYFGADYYFDASIGLGGSVSQVLLNEYGNGIVGGPQLQGTARFPMGEGLLGVKVAYTYGLNQPSVAMYTNREYFKNERGLFSLGLYYSFKD